MNEPSRPLVDCLLLAGFCGFLFFFGLAYFGLVGPDEPRYAQVAREMLARRDWITPTLGGAPWLEKPPLYYWQAMLAYRLFGVSDWAARLPPAVDATFMVVAVYLFLLRFRPGFHLDGALMTASAAGVVGFARAAATDMPLAATLTISLLAWLAWHESRSRRYLALFYIFLALSVLAKGPVGGLAGLIIVLFAGAQRKWALIRQTLWMPGVLLFCVIALPWYGAAQAKNPEFLRIFLVQHNLERFSTNLYHHPQPFWYYVPVVLLGLMPWTIFAIAALTETIRAWWKEHLLLQSEDEINGFLLIWLVVPVVFFSISRSKLPGYIVPALPAGALLLAEYVRRHSRENKRPDIFMMVAHSFMAALPIVPAMMLQYIVFQHRLPWGRAMVMPLVLAGVLAIGMALTLRTPLGLRMLRFVTLVPVVLAVATVLRLGPPALDATLSARPLAAEIGRIETRPMPLAVFRVSRATEYGLKFYRNQPIGRYERGQIPPGEHLVVAPLGFRTSIAEMVAGRRVSYLGSFAAQGLDYFWVAAKTSN